MNERLVRISLWEIGNGPLTRRNCHYFMSEEQRLNVKAGMVVKVHEKIKDVSPKGEERERIQIFEGTVLATRGSGQSRTFRILKSSERWKVEKIFPFNSPNITKIELVKQMKVRRAKIDYLKKKTYGRKLKEQGKKK